MVSFVRMVVWEIVDGKFLTNLHALIFYTPVKQYLWNTRLTCYVIIAYMPLTKLKVCSLQNGLEIQS